MTTTAPAMFALLVGIDQYVNDQELPTLAGCVNDVDSVEQLLRDKFAVPPDSIKKLTNAQATHAAIKQAIHDHLLGNARAWAAAGSPAPPPAFLFYYSGHGSQAVDETGREPDGMDETICPHDSRTQGVFDIKDWELGQFFDELSGHSENVTVVLDCCHSGSGLRALSRRLVRTRRAPPDLRPQPTEPPLAPGQVRARTRGVHPAADANGAGRHVLLAGCRDREEANEHPAPEGNGQRLHGALSYFLLRELARMSPDRPLTYRELHERVRYQVNAEYPDQAPQCEGDRDREVFGGLRPQRDVFLTVLEKRDGRIWLDGGAAHGLTEGTLLKVYAPETRTLAASGDALGTLEVEEVGAVRSACVPAAESAGVEVPLHARAAVHRLNHGDMRRRVVLDVPGERAELLAALRARLAQGDVTRYVEVVAGDAPAEFRIALVDHALQIQDAGGALLVAPFGADDLDGIALDLAHLVRYRNALLIRNTADFSELAGAVSLTIKRLVFDPTTQQPGAEPLPTPDAADVVAQVGDRVVFEISNHADRPLHVALFDFSPDWSVTQLYPPARDQGVHQALAPGGTISLGLARERRNQFFASLPEGMAEGRDTFKLIATVEDADFEVLNQGALKSPFTTRAARPRRASGTPSALDRLLAQAMTGGRTRAWGPPPSTVADEWITAECTALTVHPPDAARGSAFLAAGREARLPDFGLIVQPPAGFQGAIRVLTRSQSVRAAGGDSAHLEVPPGLAGNPDLFQPLEFRTTRAAGPGAAVIEIEAEAAARRQVTEATPLRLTVPAALAGDREGLVALAFDGSFYYPVGRSTDSAGAPNTIAVEWLPEPDAADATPVRSRRSLGRIVKLFVFKRLGWTEASLGLHRARFIPSELLPANPLAQDERQWKTPGGEVRYRPLRSGDVQAGQRVAVLVHGFSSDTPWMVTGPTQFLAQHGLHYDHVLTFDYETFGTGISESGQTLAEALRAAGLGAQDGVTVDVIAHSMGTLVSRSMIELWGGDDFVDRLVLAGPPNRGTRLAELPRFGLLLATLLLNHAGPTPPALLAKWALKRLADQAAGPRDLRPDSEIIDRLNRSTKPARLPYLVLAGRNDLPAESRGPWQRLYRKVLTGADALLDTFFADQHDQVISVPSMLGVRNGTYPAHLLRSNEVGCNHFDYFRDQEAQQHLLAWLRQP